MSAREIAAFILARLAEEEADARAAPSGPWVWAAVGASGYPQRITNGEAILIATCYENPDFRAACAEHIARQDPAATLARVEVLRAMAGWATEPMAVIGGANGAWLRDELRDGALRHVASIWRSHPDFDPAWTP